MKVSQIMTTTVRTCSPETNLAAAAALLLDGDCGILPVVVEGRVTAVITDRDMYIALATRNARPSQLNVAEVARAPVWTVSPDDDVHRALGLMKQHCVRRLPVVGFGDSVLGMVSMNDLVLAAGARKPVRSDEVVEALQAICAHRQPPHHVTAA